MKIGSTYPRKKILPLYCLWWTFCAIAQVFVLHRLGLSWQVSVIDSIVSNTVLGVSCFIVITVYRYYQPGGGDHMYRALYGIGISVIVAGLVHWSLRFVYHNNTAYLAFLMASMPVRFMFTLLMVSFVSVLIWLSDVLEEQSAHAMRKAEAEQLVKEAELVKLRQQLQPHFLFNSLNSISALAGARPDEARRMIQQLSDFLRGTLRKDEQQTVPLQEELDHLKLYLDIEKVRFGHRLNVELKVDESSTKALIPPLLLQPIVENAIKFGLYGTIDGITVSISGRLENSYLVMEVTNPFDEETQNVKQGTGFGLSSIQRRLFLLYSRGDLLATEKKENLFSTRLKIPQLK